MAAQQLSNPFAGHDDYHCFGCDPRNSAGLHLAFWLEDDEVFANWTPERRFEGYPGVVHGGVQATLCDEVGAWFIYAVYGTAGVTSEMHIEYHRPMVVAQAPFVIRAVAGTRTDRRATPTVTITGADGKACTTAHPTFAIFPEPIARRRFDFPGRDAFVTGPD